MKQEFNINDLVYLWGDKDQEPMKIIGITHYPGQEAVYQLWAMESNCLVRGIIYKHNLLPINE